MFQDIAPFSLDIGYKAATPAPQDYLLLLQGDQLLLRADTHTLPQYGDLADAALSCTYLLSAGDAHFFYSLPDAGFSPSSYALVPDTLRVFHTYEPAHIGFAAVTACHLARWYEANRFCGRCGSPMVEHPTERALTCSSPVCSRIVYPTISPAVIVGIRNNDQLLLTRYAGRAAHHHALVAGYCEIGETLEATIAREVMEEVGLKVKNLHYYKSQPWAFSQSLLMGFYADLDGSPAITLQESELAEAAWFSRDALPVGGSPGSLTHEMIERFREGKV